MSEPLTDKSLWHLENSDNPDPVLTKIAVVEIRELRSDKQMLLDNSDELETCVSELKADNALLRRKLEATTEWLLKPEINSLDEKNTLASK